MILIQGIVLPYLQGETYLLQARDDLARRHAHILGEGGQGAGEHQ